MVTLLISQKMERTIKSETIEYIIFCKKQKPALSDSASFGYCLRSPS